VSPNKQANAQGAVATDTPQISVILPTRNRSALLRTLLGDLTSQQAGDLPFEVVVVDNASRDDTRAVAMAAAARDARLRYVYEPARGASNARNRGIAAARAPLLAFLDDDVRPAADWVFAAWRAITSKADVDCLGGRIEPQWPSPPPSWLTHQLFGPVALQIGRGNGAVFDRDHASACLLTANFVCRASALREVGGFSPDFLRDEDRELNLRLWRSGKRGLYDDTVVVYAQVQAERLTRRYHRAWHAVTGRSHARLRYRDLIDRDGRLVATQPPGRRVWDVPGFLYREFGEHASAWGSSVARFDLDGAFYHECRMRYLTAYFTTRWQEHWRERAARTPILARSAGRRKTPGVGTSTPGVSSS
jgi:glycosyltransferase involved in cell wall biosynthesis